MLIGKNLEKVYFGNVIIMVLAIAITGISVSVWAKPYNSAKTLSMAVLESLSDTTKSIVLTDDVKLSLASSNLVDTLAINSSFLKKMREKGELLSSDVIKAKVIDYFIDNFESVVIGNEIMYGSSRKKVDLLALYKGETYAIEIKSSKDDLRRLPEQLSDYSKIFDYTMVFATIDHIAKIRVISKRKISVFEVSNDVSIEGVLRKKKNNVLKCEMLATMNSLFLRTRLGIFDAKDSDKVRKKAMRYKREKIHNLLYEYFMEKLTIPYKQFLYERNGRTAIDDISILSNRLKVE